MILTARVRLAGSCLEHGLWTRPSLTQSAPTGILTAEDAQGVHIGTSVDALSKCSLSISRDVSVSSVFKPHCIWYRAWLRAGETFPGRAARAPIY